MENLRVKIKYFSLHLIVTYDAIDWMVSFYQSYIRISQNAKNHWTLYRLIFHFRGIVLNSLFFDSSFMKEKNLLIYNNIQLFNVWKVSKPEYFPEVLGTAQCNITHQAVSSTERDMFWSIDWSNIKLLFYSQISNILV